MRFLRIICTFLVLIVSEKSINAQIIDNSKSVDSIKLKYPVPDSKTLDLNSKSTFGLPNPSNIKRTIEFDPITKQYIITEKIGNQNYRPSQYLTIGEYQQYENNLLKKEYWKELSQKPITFARDSGFIPSLVVKSRSFERIFGGSKIDIRPQGTAEVSLSGRLTNNQNPLLNERQRKQGNFDFNERIQLNVVGQIGEKLRLSTNYNTEAQFDFENQMKLDYTGKPDEIIQKIEAGNVSLPLNSTLITGSQALFGIKTKLKFGRLDVTSVLSQQKSQQKEITITNGSQQNDFRLTADSYEQNKHYFLAQYFRNNYNKALSNIPVINSAVNITKIEVWVTNRNNSTTDSRDILGLLDLGENQPYNTTLFRGGAGFSSLPAGFNGPGFTQQSNNILQNLPQDAQFTNSSAINSYFQPYGGTDNFVKLTYARKLTDKEFTLNPRLGYISLNSSLNADEVLAVSYRYTYNGVEYQVGQFSTDVPVDPSNPKMLLAKLLKNETVKINLPTWDLMMKNIYSLGAYQVSSTNFNLNIYRLDENTGAENPVISEGQQTSGKLWISLTGLDNLDKQNSRKPDGYFDYLDGITIDSRNGRITFPVLEPFGSDLANQFNAISEQPLIQKYVYQPLYDSTKVIAQQLFSRLNRYVIRGTYQSDVSSEFQLNSINVPQGSVQVFAGTLPLTEGLDFTVDYNVGIVKILNTALLNSGQTIRIKLENSELFGLQQRTLIGSRFDYKASNKLNLGATVMNLTEKPVTQKVNIGEDPIANTMLGLDASYSSDSRWLTRMVDKLPFINTKEVSKISFYGEVADLIPGHPKALNFAGSKDGVSYLDDFESTKTVIDIKSAINWQISGTPQLFAESQLTNNLSYGYNRALLSYYNIDPLFFNSTNTLNPANIRNNAAERSNHYVRQVLEKEVFPLKESTTGQALILPTLDLAYYPTLRGPYNFSTTGINPDGTLANPRSRWAGIFKKMETTDFESLNIDYIEFWMLDPFIYKQNAQGGDLYFNLGSVSEDILKDGRKSLENGLPANSDPTATDQTAWGKVPKLQPAVQAFDNDPVARKLQDVGLDGLTNEEEKQFFSNYINQVKGQVNAQAAAQVEADPASDNFQYFRGSNFDNTNAGILKRYERYNGTEGNSKTSQQSLEETGLENSASTSVPDGEDINRDNNSSQADEYFQYKVSVRPQDMEVGKNFIADRINSTVKLANGKTDTVRWYQFKIPIAQYQQKVGNIQDFKSIRFVRMFMTDFADTTVMRFAKLQLVRGDWRQYNAENSPSKALADSALGVNPPLDNSTIEVSTVNIEENSRRVPIPYVVPPGIVREQNFSNLNGTTYKNEQSLAVVVRNLRDGYGRSVYRTTYNDFRSYGHLQMFIHAEGDQLRDNDVNAFIRLGTDDRDNYYEYAIPLKATHPGATNSSDIWPDVNNLDIDISKLQQAKTARNGAILNGRPWPVTVPYRFTDGNNTITIMGQPDLSKVRVYMLGVRNPLRKDSGDDGLDKSVEIWFNELRLSGFNEKGGWAATARMNLKLADFADVSLSGSKTTVGFGSIDKRVNERSRSDDNFFDFSSNFELGKFFADRTGIKIPMFFNYSNQKSTPQYDPKNQDVELSSVINSLSKRERDSILGYAQDVTSRRSISFNNVRKIRTDPTKKAKIWDIENWAASYGYTSYYHHDYTNQLTLQNATKASIAYTYSSQPKVFMPFAKLIKSNNLAFIRDINFSLMPTSINFRMDADRMYSENTPRNNDISTLSAIRTTYNKTFQLNRYYGISWNLTKSMQIDFNATNNGIIDEPDGPINGIARDSIWKNLKKLGRTNNYQHILNVNYTLPINKFPGFNWVNIVTRYQAQFDWVSEPLSTLTDPNINIGNTIRNARIVQVNPTLNLVSLYSKFGFIKRSNKDDNTFSSVLINALTSIKSINGAYTRTQGTILPGYMPKTNLFGLDFDMNAPGWGFVFGSQKDIRGKAISKGWITTDSLQNSLFITNFKEDLNLRGTIEPIRDLRIELSGVKSRSLNYSTTFKFSSSASGFENQSPVTSGDYSISFFSLRTSFKNQDNLYKQFEITRSTISRRLGSLNPNSLGMNGEYADGYGKNSQDVVVSSFLATYGGSNPERIGLKGFPKIPVPGWRLSYIGLTKYDFFSNIFSSFNLNHAYRSTYNINSFSTLIRYGELNGFVNVKDANGDFLPSYQFSQVTLSETFEPLLGVDFRLKNNLSANFEIRKSRLISMSLINSQLTHQNIGNVVFGLGYRTTKFRFPFGMFSRMKTSNDVNFKMDFAITDSKTVIYRADVSDPEVASGSKIITIRPSVDYLLNQRFNLRLYYDGTITKPYTSQTFNTSFSNFGVSLRLTLQ